MKKTSVYLRPEDETRLDWLAERERASEAEIIRRAIASYEPNSSPDRDFAGARSGEGPGTSVADMDEDELLRGFGR